MRTYFVSHKLNHRIYFRLSFLYNIPKKIFFSTMQKKFKQSADILLDILQHIYHNFDVYSDYIPKESQNIRRITYYSAFMLNMKCMTYENEQWSMLFLSELSDDFYVPITSNKRQRIY
jgi:hypothetical protein